jgi:acetyl esterase/lipase
MVTDILDRPAPPPDRTVRYGPESDQVIDIRLPSGPVTGPPVVFVHGGFWRARYDRAHAGPLAADLAGRGHPVAVIEYRRVGQPGGGWPGTLDDVRAAVVALPDLAGPRFAAPVLAGHSAGGHLALWVARQVPARGVLALAPVADLALGHGLNLGAGAVAALLGGGPADVPDRYAAADPARLLPLGVPCVIVHGQEDRQVPVTVSRSYVARARAAGDRIHLVEVPDMDHFAVIDPGSPAWSTVHTALSAFAAERSVDAD